MIIAYKSFNASAILSWDAPPIMRIRNGFTDRCMDNLKSLLSTVVKMNSMMPRVYFHGLSSASLTHTWKKSIVVSTNKKKKHWHNLQNTIFFKWHETWCQVKVKNSLIYFSYSNNKIAANEIIVATISEIKVLINNCTLPTDCYCTIEATSFIL